MSTRVTLRGANSSKVIGGFGLTEVDADFWAAWLKQNPKHPALRSGAIFAYGKRDKATDHAIDHETIKVGLEESIPPSPAQAFGPFRSRKSAPPRRWRPDPK